MATAVEGCDFLCLFCRNWVSPGSEWYPQKGHLPDENETSDPPFCKWDQWNVYRIYTHPETNSKRTWKWMVGILLSYWEGPFSGAMLVSGSISFSNLLQLASTPTKVPMKPTPSHSNPPSWQSLSWRPKQQSPPDPWQVHLVGCPPKGWTSPKFHFLGFFFRRTKPMPPPRK